MVVLACNPNTWDADAGGQPRIHDEKLSQSIKIQLLCTRPSKSNWGYERNYSHACCLALTEDVS